MAPRSRNGSLVRRRRGRGSTYLGMLLAIAILGIGLAAAGTVWTLQAQREREAQLLFVGHAYRDAIARYYSGGPVAHQLPQELAELLQDERQPLARRYLRQLYPDPMTGRADWQLLRDPDGGIYGVASSSQHVPLKRANFTDEDVEFAGADCYCKWRFEFSAAQVALHRQPR